MILITAKAHPILIDSFEQNGYKVLYAPEITHEDLLQKINIVTGLVVTTRLKIDKAIIDAAINLKWIARLGSGMELIDTNYAVKNNIACISSPEGNCNAVAEHAVGLLLAAKNNIVKSVQEVKEKKWIRDANRGVEIAGNTIGIIGYGNTGHAFAKLISVFGGTILAHDKYKNDFGGKLVREAELEQISKYADIISFHLPLADDTKHIANDAFFDGLQNKPFILNTSRGNIIETSALINALKNGKICGAALDVLENENLEKLTETQKEHLDYLLQNEKVLITPHIAGYTNEAFLKMSTVILQKLKALNLF